MARGGQSSQNPGEPHDWVTRAADDAIRHAGPDATLITCASGASPSGPVHLGNLREFLTVHFVAEEIRRRGIAVRHLHSWDDYDRFRKVPAGVDEAWAEHIGRPLSAVPDPWSCHESWAEHFKAPLQAALAEMGVEREEVSQTERYRSGAYRDQILTAVAHRAEIEEVMAQYRTKAAPVVESEEEAAALEDSVANDEEPEAGAGAGHNEWARFPYKPYCRDCGRDTTIITDYDDATTDQSYNSTACDNSGETNLPTESEGK
ncbi:MAG: lysS, partial [Nocardioides sp.]|nr:lysS [Nocardioides sp.]